MEPETTIRTCRPVSVKAAELHRRESRLESLFLYSAAALLLMTAAVKVASAFGRAPILSLRDPLLEVPYRYLFCVAAALETAVAWRVLSRRGGCQGKAGWMVWIATLFAAYRIGLRLLGAGAPCRCLGNLTDALQISPHTADNLAEGILLYLLAGGCAILWRSWWRARH